MEFINPTKEDKKKSKGKEDPKEVTNMRLPADLKIKVKRKALDNDLNFTQAVIEALERWVEKS